jgi:hypothetical protein
MFWRYGMGTLVGSAIVLVLGGCTHRRPAAAAAAAAHEADAGPQVALTNTSFVVSSCPDATKMDSRVANAAMRKMVEPCGTVPGQAARFRATLVPGGRIELASPTGDRAEGVVPLCVLKNRLTHSVQLKERCTFDVQLEERKIPGPQDSNAKP